MKKQITQAKSHELLRARSVSEWSKARLAEWEALNTRHAAERKALDAHHKSERERITLEYPGTYEYRSIKP